MSPGAAALGRLAERIEAEGEPLVLLDRRDPVIPEYPAEDPRFGDLAAAGPRSVNDPATGAFVVEAIREGYLCHYGRSRLLDLADPDLGLLAGDLLYAIGLNELSRLGDLESTGILSDLIRVAADLWAGGGPELAEVLWTVQTVALSCGKPPDYEAGLEAVAGGDRAALGALFDWAETTADRAGAGPELRVAAKAIHFPPSNL